MGAHAPGAGCATILGLILGESLGHREWAAMALTLGGVTLALQRA